MLLANICSSSSVLSVMRIVSIVIKALCIAVPIIMILSIMIKAASMISKDEQNSVNVLLKNSVTKFIAAVCLFLIPTFINIVVSISGDGTYLDCIKNATPDKIEKAKEDEAITAVNKVKQSLKNYDLVVAKNLVNKLDNEELKEKLLNELKDVDKQIKENEKQNDSNITSNDYYKSTSNGLSFITYNQSDSKWANLVYSDGITTVSDNGCMITSVAVVTSAYNASITPETVFNSNYRNEYPHTSINDLTNNKFSCISGSVEKNNIIDSLKSGKVMVIQVHGKNHSVPGSSSFTSSQHYMALIDYNVNDKKIYIGNGYGSLSGYSAIGWFSEDEVLTSVFEAYYCTPTE